jgi:hypothetical protein
MKCHEAEGQFADFLGERGSKELRRRIKTHLKGCKKCQGRLNLLKKGEASAAVGQETDDLRKNPPGPSPSFPMPESDAAAAEPPLFQKGPSPLRFMPVISIAMVLLVAGGLYLLSKGSDKKEITSLVDQKPIQLAVESPPSVPLPEEKSAAAEENSAAAAQAPPASNAAGEAEAAPLIKKAGNGKPQDLLPKKAGNGKPADLSKRAREKLKPAEPPVKLLLISRDLKEATEAIQLQAAQSDGKILEKNEGDLASKFVLLIPASQYEPFFQSLQELGLAKKTSQKELPVAGSLRLEVTIE